MRTVETDRPATIYPTTYDWVTRTTQPPDSYHELAPATSLTRRLPRTVGPEIHWKFRARQCATLAPTFIAEILDGRVWGDEGAVITPDGGLLADLVAAYQRDAAQHPLFSVALPPPVNLDGTAVLLTARGARRTYSHWLLDVLPRLHVFRTSVFGQESVNYYIINSTATAFQRETLRLVGVPSEQIIASDHYPHLRVARLLVPSRAYTYSDIYPWTASTLRTTCLPKSAPAGPARIFISRRDACHRQVVNEDDVRKFLERLGFVTVRLAELTVLEQAALFADARVIVTPHGSGLANLVFSPIRAKVIELFSPRAVNPCFWAVGDMCDLDYYYALGQGERPREGDDPFLILEDIRVDIEELAALLCIAGVDNV